MDICHLKNAELEPEFPKCKGRIVLRGDIVKDDSGSCAVFTEQGSSASETQLQNLWMSLRTTWQWWTSSWRGISMHSGNDRGCSQIAQNPKVRMSRYMDTPSTTSMANVVVKHWRYSGSSWKTIIRTLTCWPLVGKTVRSSIGTRMGKSTELGMFFHRKQGLFLLVCVDDMTGKM